MAMTQKLLPVLLASFLLAAPGAPDTALEVEALTDKGSYSVGETVHISVRACNPLDEWHTEVMNCTVCLDHGCFCCSHLMIMDSNDAEVAYLAVPPMGCPAMDIEYLFAPGECKEVGSVWHQLEGGFPVYPPEIPGDQVSTGTYTVRMEWRWDGPVFESPPFEITDVLFSDGFESGNTSAWSGVAP